MIEDGQIVLSSLLLGVALAGLVVSLRRSSAYGERHWLTLIFASLAVFSSLPASATLFRPFYLFHLPALLPCLMAFPVLIMGYVDSRMVDKPASQLSLYHWCLPLAGLLVTLGYWAQTSSIKQTLFIRGELPAGMLPAALTLSTFILLGIWSLATIAYLLRINRSLRDYRTRLKDLYSNTDRIDLRWADSLLLLITALSVGTLLSLISDNIGYPIPAARTIVLILSAATFLTLIGFAITEAPLGNRADHDGLKVLPNLPKPRYEKSPLSDVQADRIAQRIKTVMQRDSLFLDPSLSLSKLASAVQAPENLVSQTINTRLNSTFFDLIAHWRIAAALPLVLEDKLPILDIALRVGFNTRSTFYKAFKRETGMTPSTYRQYTRKSGQDLRDAGAGNSAT